jgi:hypothetical protein
LTTVRPRRPVRSARIGTRRVDSPRASPRPTGPRHMEACLVARDDDRAQVPGLHAHIVRRDEAPPQPLDRPIEAPNRRRSSCRYAHGVATPWLDHGVAQPRSAVGCTGRNRRGFVKSSTLRFLHAGHSAPVTRPVRRTRRTPGDVFPPTQTLVRNVHARTHGGTCDGVSPERHRHIWMRLSLYGQ